MTTELQIEFAYRLDGCWRLLPIKAGEFFDLALLADEEHVDMLLPPRHLDYREYLAEDRTRITGVKVDVRDVGRKWRRVEHIQYWNQGRCRLYHVRSTVPEEEPEYYALQTRIPASDTLVTTKFRPQDGDGVMKVFEYVANVANELIDCESAETFR